MSNTDGLDWTNDIDDLVDKLRLDLGFLPYDPTPHGLYTAADLYEGMDGGFEATVDQKIYRRARTAGSPPIAPVEMLAHRLHDHGITVALDEFRADKQLVGLMGGHAMPRGSAGYRQVVALGRELTIAGFCVATGGGPGAMEAANLGAASAAMAEGDVEALVDTLAEVPTFAGDPDSFIGAALTALAAIPDPQRSLSVPTWFYGHEPSNPFATDIAKYFLNSEREAGLLALATSGIVFVPGGPGTLQEVFQDGAQNAYETFGPSAPMLFLDNPDDPGWWERSGVLTALDRAFVDHHGQPRAGRDLVAFVESIDQLMGRLGSGRG